MSTQQTQVEPIQRERGAEPQQRKSNGHPPQDQPGQAQPQQGAHGEPIPKDLPKPGAAMVVLVSLVLAGCLAGLFVLGWIPHERAEKQANSDAADLAGGPPTVSVANPKTENVASDVVLPCSVRAWAQAALFARVTGYLKQWNYDIGSHVKQGDVLAVLSSPDVDAQLNQTKAALEQAKATVVKSQADLDVARTDYDRYLKSQQQAPGSVTEEDIDSKKGAFEDAEGALQVAVASVKQDEAAVDQLAVSQGFEQITAPFSGAITARNYDVGALITASNTAAGAELFDIADTGTLRVFVNVPQTYSTRITIGQPAYLTVRNYASRQYQGTVTRMAGALDPTTRTLPFELDFPNPDGSLYAGMYGTARLPTTEADPPLVIPSSSLIFDAAGPQVAVIEGSRAHFRKIVVGRDFGTEMEVTEGLKASDSVVTNPGEKLVDGVQVQINQPATQP